MRQSTRSEPSEISPRRRSRNQAEPAGGARSKPAGSRIAPDASPAAAAPSDVAPAAGEREQRSLDAAALGAVVDVVHKHEDDGVLRVGCGGRARDLSAGG